MLSDQIARTYLFRKKYKIGLPSDREMCYIVGSGKGDVTEMEVYWQKESKGIIIFLDRYGIIMQNEQRDIEAAAQIAIREEALGDCIYVLLA